MIVDQIEEVLRKTTLFPLPTATASASAVPTSVAPIPTVVPDTPTEQFAGDSGSRTLWVVFVLMVLASAGFAFMSWRIPVSKRLYHVITTIITIIAAISYFAMATGHGVSVHETIVHHQHDHVPDTTEVIHRQVFWARYVDWSLTTPLLILDLGLLAGMNGAHITMAIIADLIMVLTGLFAAYGSEGTPQKWGWYTIGCIAYIFVIWHLALNGGNAATNKGPNLRSFFVLLGGYTLLLWTAYPIVWGFADGARRVSVDGEIIAYAVLDILAKPVFGAVLLITHTKLRESDIDVGGFWAHGLNTEGLLRVGDDDGA